MNNIFAYTESIEIVLDTKDFNFIYNEVEGLFKIVNPENKSLEIEIKDKIIFNNFLKEFFINTENKILLPTKQCKELLITTQDQLFTEFILNNKSVNIICR
jgi:hypothetical protein